MITEKAFRKYANQSRPFGIHLADGRAIHVPHGVIPAVLLPFDNDFAIDEASFRKHLRDVAAVEGLSAITINAHSSAPTASTKKPG